MSSSQIDDYVASLSEPARSTVSRLRLDLLDLVPDATEAISYSMPAVLLRGKAIAGYAVFKNHIGYFPHSSLVVSRIPELAQRFKVSKGGFQFPLDQPLERDLVAKLVTVRLEVLAEQYPQGF
jgi:uncharacterized protein YdhG (YjbR/CyaY superfamily)